MTPPVLRTERLELRAVRKEDAAALHAIFIEPGVRRFLFDDQLLTRDEADRLVEGWLDREAWAIWRLVDGQMVGAGALTPVSAATARYQPTLDGGFEFVVAIAERTWGQGIAAEAGRAIVAYGFDEAGMDRIVAVVDVPNARSHRLMARLGFMPGMESDGPKHRMRGYEAFRRSGT